MSCELRADSRAWDSTNALELHVQVAIGVHFLNQLDRLREGDFAEFGQVVVVDGERLQGTVCIVLDRLRQSESALVLDFVVTEVEVGQYFVDDAERLRERRNAVVAKVVAAQIQHRERARVLDRIRECEAAFLANFTPAHTHGI